MRDTGSGVPGARLRIRVTPGSSRDSLAWDPWRSCWTVSCRAVPLRGRANQAVAALLAGWLRVPPESVRWERAGSSREKTVRIEGITTPELEQRLAPYRLRPAADPGGTSPQ
ncbi:MAG TPA: DUF167 family protein [Thermoplasmata archaeon]|nr:DUF167 family protein [Thermoplasmata archaeon]